MIDRSRFGLNRIICPSLDIKEFFQLTNELEFDYVELRNDLPGRGMLDSYSTQEISLLTQQYNIQICSINALQKFNFLEEIERIKKELTPLLDLAKEICCRAIVLCPMNEKNDQRSPEKQYQDTVYILKALIPFFKNYGILGYIEPLGFTTSSLSSLITVMKVIKEVGYEGYRIVYDTFHHSIGPDDLDSLNKRYDIQLTGLVHISSVTKDIPQHLQRDEYRNINFARDRLNCKGQIDFLLKKGYQGIISFEPFAREVQRLNKEELKIQINKAIEYLNLE